MFQNISRCWVALLAGAFLTLPPIGAQAAIPTTGGPLGVRAVGALAWGLVAAGFLGVALTVWASGRPKPRRRLIRAESGGQIPEKMVHSPVYTPPPHRRQYKSCQVRR